MKRIICILIVCIIFITLIFSQPPAVDYGNNPQAGHYALVNGIQLYYETYGSGEPLIMLHGNGGSINAFSNQIPFFEKYYQVIAIDSRLQGKSGGSPDSISYELMASDFCELLEHLNIQSANVLGWSDGGIDGIIMAMNCPNRIKMLAVSGANIVPDTTALTEADLQGMKDFVMHPESASKTAVALVQMMIDQPNIPYTDLKKIQCPVLVMAGDQDMIKHGHTLKIFQSIPRASLCIFPDSRHEVCQQHPELFNETVLSFLKKKK
ncbi:MAG TPA: alpha/beta hydrolase [Prolixibacteraceae bacterium]|nr:alpha/beta hydrolase [Prolixibacteraceae bacterium]